jgi:uncharacterized membrane protein
VWYRVPEKTGRRWPLDEVLAMIVAIAVGMFITIDLLRIPMGNLAALLSVIPVLIVRSVFDARRRNPT